MKTMRAEIFRAAARRIDAAWEEREPVVITGAIMTRPIGTKQRRLNALRWFWDLYPENGPFYIDPNHAPIALLFAALVSDS